MNTRMKQITQGVFAAFAVLLTTISVPVSADDTEIYLSTTVTTEYPPNILFVLDESLSMTWRSANNNNPDRSLGELSRMEELQIALRSILSRIDNANVGIMTFTSELGYEGAVTPIRYPIADVNGNAMDVESGAPFQLVSIDASNDDAVQKIVGNTVTTNESSLRLGSIASASDTLDIDIEINSDDAEQNYASGVMNQTTTSKLSTPHDGSTKQLVGLRFNDVDIPKANQITSAKIRVYAQGSVEQPARITINAEASDNPATFSSAANNISSRPTTGSPVSWVTASWPNNQWRDSTDVASLLTILKDRPDWNDTGESVVFILGNHAVGSLDSGTRGFDAREESGSNQARLIVQHTQIPSRTITGLRFIDLNIPQGAEITSASLLVTAADSSNQAMDVTISGEQTDDAAAFTTAVDNIGARGRTTKSASWVLTTDSADAWVNEQPYSSVDIKEVIQEIVDRPGWCGGNDLALILQANINSDRTIFSVDEGEAVAPKLHIDFDSNVPEFNARTDDTPNTGCTGIKLEMQVDSTDDDAEEVPASGVMDVHSTTDSKDLDAGEKYIGVRFENVLLPDVGVEDITIENATLTFTSNATTFNGSSSYKIYGEKSANSLPFKVNTRDISNRTKTTTSSDWSIATTVNDGVVKETTDVSAIVKEIIGTDGWFDSKNLTFIIQPASGSTTFNRPFSASDFSRVEAPKLKLAGRYNRAGKDNLPPVFTVRDRLLSIVDQLKPDYATSTMEAYYEAVQYFRGGPVHFGAKRQGKPSRRVSHPDSYIGGLSSPAACSFSDDSSCSNEAITASPQYISPITRSCAQNHIVLLTDGDPNKDSSVGSAPYTYWDSNVIDYIEALLKSEDDNPVQSCARSGTQTFTNSYETCGRELAQFIAAYNQADSVYGQQRITTHTIAFALSDGGAKTFLEDVAEAGGGLNKAPNNADGLIAAFESIFQQAVEGSASFAAPSLSINSYNRFFNGDDIFFSFFKPGLRPLWEGNIKRYKLCSDPVSQGCDLGELMYYDGTVLKQATNDNGEIIEDAISIWSAGKDGAEVTQGGAEAKIPIPDNRVVYTYLGSDNTPSSPVNLTTDDGHKVVTLNNGLDAGFFGVADENEADELIEWIRGDDIDDEYENRDERWRIADPLHSSPVAITYGVADNGDEDTTNDPAVTKLVVGTNEGGIRMINATTGIEEWLFIPQVMLQKQAEARNNVGSVRFYGIDGVPSVYVYDKDQDGLIEPLSDTNDPDHEYARLFIGQRRGGNRYYALDITPAGALNGSGDEIRHDAVPPKFMWSIGGGETGFERLGQTWSKPAHTRIRMNGGLEKNVVIFGGGYDETLDNSYAPALPSPTQGNAIYIVDAKTGEMIWSASSDLSAKTITADMKYAIPSDVGLLDSDGDGYTDRIYVADIAGQLWRVDIAPNMTTASVGDTKVAKVAELSDLSSPFAAADQRRFFYPPDIVEVLDTTYSNSSRYNLLLITSGNRAHPLDKTVQDRMFAIRDYVVGNIPSGGYTTITDANLADVTANVIQDGETEGARESAVTELKGKSGWYFNFDMIHGEKGLSSGTTLEGTAFFTTYLPDATQEEIDECTLKYIGTGRLYAVNVLSGAAVFPKFDNVDDDLSKEDRFMNAGGMGGIPPEFVPVFQEEGVTGCVGTHCGIETGINLPRYRSYWSEALDE